MKPLAALFSVTFLALPAGAMVIASYDFNTNGANEGWTEPPSVNITGLTVAGGNLSGTASSNDPQLRNNGVNLTVGGGQTWDKFIFRVRETQDEVPVGTIAFDPVGLVVTLNNSGPLTYSSGFSAVDSGDGFFTVSVDISSAASTTITSIRLDPIGGASSNSNSQTTGNTFDVDFIELTAVPEPAVTILGSFGLLALLRRRRSSL